MGRIGETNEISITNRLPRSESCRAVKY